MPFRKWQQKKQRRDTHNEHSSTIVPCCRCHCHGQSIMSVVRKKEKKIEDYNVTVTLNYWQLNSMAFKSAKTTEEETTVHPKTAAALERLDWSTLKWFSAVSWVGQMRTGKWSSQSRAYTHSPVILCMFAFGFLFFLRPICSICHRLLINFFPSSNIIIVIIFILSTIFDLTSMCVHCFRFGDCCHYCYCLHYASSLNESKLLSKAKLPFGLTKDALHQTHSPALRCVLSI